MGSEKVVINGFTLSCYNINTLIIGSGAASLNAAVSLRSLGQEDILIATARWGGGTSNNAGSDKQTYYKLSLSGREQDSVYDMAKDLYNGRCMHGDIALCEAQGSVQAFLNLVRLGVAFPCDKYGSWAEYKTDHDRRGRATSTGPYTSKRMFQALAEEVKRLKIKVLDNHYFIALLPDKSGGKVIGALAINLSEKDYRKAFVLFNSTNVILGTGGPGGIYEASVYPPSQQGSIGMAVKAGATAQNLTESQFGIASLKFKWNLSGSYQQSIPRYYSTDIQGKDEKEFLNDFFPDEKTLLKAIFLKGYQWPFDPGKVKEYGSSLIDLLVTRETNEKGRKVFIDYRRNPSWNGDESFQIENMDNEVENYLRNCNSVKPTPVERLKAINTPAYKLYKEHGIDLEKEPLQVAVCAQHNNGGLKANIWWESDLLHLFPVGEVNGSHGVHRPGGSALNSGQVGSYRAAQYISKKLRDPSMPAGPYLSEVKGHINEYLNLAASWMNAGIPGDNKIHLSEIRKRTTDAAGIIREIHKVTKASSDAAGMFRHLSSELAASSVEEMAESFMLLDHCFTHFIYLEAIRTYLKMGGRSRGSYIVTTNSEEVHEDSFLELQNPVLCLYDRDIESEILELKYKDSNIITKLVEVRDIPDQELWFEKIWKEYLEDKWLES